MNTEVLGVIAQIVLMVVLSYPLGKYIAKVYKGEKTWSDFMKPVERVMFKLSGINPNEEMNWKQFLRALLVVNLFGSFGGWYCWLHKVCCRLTRMEMSVRLRIRHSILVSVSW